MDMAKGVFKKKRFHPGPLMPAGIVHPEIDDLPLEATEDPLQHLQEAVGIPLHPLHDPVPTLQRIDPSEDVQPKLMLTASIDERPTSFLGPHPTQLRMQRKARFVLKEDHPSLVSQRQEEFFYPPPGMVLPPPLSPGQTGAPGAAGSIPTS